MRTKLLQIQAREGWTDAEMADRIGIARSTWTGIKNDRLALSGRVQLMAARALPELLGELVTSVTVTAAGAAS